MKKRQLNSEEKEKTESAIKQYEGQILKLSYKKKILENEISQYEFRKQNLKEAVEIAKLDLEAINKQINQAEAVVTVMRDQVENGVVPK